MTVSTRKVCSIAAILVLALLAVADTATAPTHAFDADGQRPASKTFSKGLVPNRLGISFRRGLEFVEEKDDKKGRRVVTAWSQSAAAWSQSAAEKAFSDTWSTALATEFGDGGGGDYAGGDYWSAHNPGSGGSSFGWPGGMAGGAGHGITGPRGGGDGNGQGGSPRRGQDPVAVPEPMTLSLVAFGFAGVAVFRLRPRELARRRSAGFRR